MASESSALPFGISRHAPTASPELELDACAAEPLEFRERRSVRWMMALADVSAAQIALALGILARQFVAAWLPNTVGPGSYRGIVLGLMALPVANWVMGLYPGYGLGPTERLRRRLLGAGVTFAGLMVWDSLVLRGGWSRGVELFSFVFAVALSPIVEAVVMAILTRRRLWGRPVIVLSSDDAGVRLVESLRRRPDLGLVPIGLLKNRKETWGKTLAGVPVLGPISLAARLAAYAHTVVVVMPSYHRAQLAALVQSLPYPNVVLVPDLPGLQSMWITPRDLGGALGLEFRRNLLLRRNYLLKRAHDYAVGVPLFLATLPLLAVLALWIKRVSPGPAFYTQEREGYRGGKVRIWKLRTMYPDAERLLESYLRQNPAERQYWNRHFKLKHDPRILPGVGHLLRRTSLDELPQLWNVLRGEMSLVGPRPFPAYHMNGFGPEFRELRQSVLPGLTGFWQVSERSDADLNASEDLDTYYIRNWSPWLDLYILTRTLKVVLMPRGAY